jgi:hypothetical protein
MGPQEQSDRQPVANLVKFRAAYHVSFVMAQDAKHAPGPTHQNCYMREDSDSAGFTSIPHALSIDPFVGGIETKTKTFG